MIFMFIVGIISIFMRLWLYGLLKNILSKKKVSLSQSFYDGVRLIPILIVVILIVAGFFLLALFALGIAALITAGIFYLSPIAGLIVMIPLIICGIILLIAACLSLSYVTPIVIMENVDAWKAIKSSYQLFMKHKATTLALGLLSVLISFLAYLPVLIYQIPRGDFFGNQQVSLFSLPNQLVSIPLAVAQLFLLVLYVLAYLRIKKGSKR